MILKGILKSYAVATHQATVQIVGSLSTWLSAIPVSHGIAAADMVVGRNVAVLTPDPAKPGESVVIALWAAATAPAAASTTKIEDSDSDTKVDVEETADDDNIVMDVAGVEAFRMYSSGILTLAKQSGARAYKSASDQTVASGNWYQIVLDGESYDNQNEFASNKFTAGKSGDYEVAACLYVNPGVANKIVGCQFRKNGAQVATDLRHTAINSAIRSFVSDIVYLAVNDYIEFWIWHNFGANATVKLGEHNTWMAIHKLS